MRIIIDINHPAHVHFFRNAISEFRNKGHEVIITASDKDIALLLLDQLGLDYIYVGKYGKSFWSKVAGFIWLNFKMFFIFLKIKPDIAMGISSARMAPKIFFKTKVFIFDDTEHAKIGRLAYKYFADKTFSPDCSFNFYVKNHILYPGYHELSYLHPDRFTPNIKTLEESGIKETEKFFIVRFVSWEAAHDVGQKGFSNKGKLKLVEILKNHGKVFISSESPLPKEFEPYRINASPAKIHDLLYFAYMYIGEGGTMASEAAVLGTPSVYVNSLKMGYLNELENKYQLLLSIPDEKAAIKKIEELLREQDLKSLWAARRKVLLQDKIDVTQFIVDLIEVK